MENLSVSRGQEQTTANTEETQAVDNADEFDPFAGEMEEVQVDIALAAPPEKEWYHGRLDRQTAEDRLRVAGERGCYLIRESDRKPGSYVLSFFGKTGVISHFKITALCGDFYIGGRQFDSLSDLIGYYTSLSDLLKSERLVYAVPPPEPVDDRRKIIGTLPYKKIPDTDELSFEKGDVFIVHNELGDGWLWVTNQQTNESGIVYQGLVKDLDGASVESLPFYHDSISKQRAAELLTKAGPGSFLVRNSDNSPGDYSLFFYCQKTIQRFRIQQKGRQYLMGGRYFDRLDSIIERYKREHIFEGCTLGQPVFRPRHDFLEDEPDLEKNRDIYASMQQSSGSDFMRLRSDNIAMKGYLSKKSEKTKRWKPMYFMLNGTETQLLYFEDVKRSKPKGLIDLSYSALYPVHDSFFNRPNCFQLAVKALNHFQVFYLSAEDADSMQLWLYHLKYYCTNTQPKRQRHKSGLLLKELNSFHLSVLDAHNLPYKHIPHPYCVISLNDIQVGRTQVKDAPDPVWEEEFFLEDLSSDIDKVVLTFYNKTKRSRDPEILQYTIHFDDLTAGQEMDEWLSLSPVLQTIKGDVGTVRLKAKFIQEVIMPLQDYTTLKEVIMAKDLCAVSALGNLCGSERIPLAQALLRIFRQDHQEALLLKTLNELEISKEESASQLFRATSLATTLMDQYMKMTSAEFVHKSLVDYVTYVVDAKPCCELNPAMLGNPADVDINTSQLLALLGGVTQSIFNSSDYCPMVLRHICWCLQKTVQAKWPDSDTVKTRVVSGFIFLRLLCPAILNPKLFNLVQETPAEVSQRSLKLVAKALQNLANLVESKEPYMEAVNPFIRENKSRMVSFLDKLSNVPECPVLSLPPVNGEVARDLAKIHQICESKLSDLQNLSASQPSLKHLVVVTEMLTNHVKHYKGETHFVHTMRDTT